MKRKVFSILLALAMLLSMLPVNALAAEDATATITLRNYNSVYVVIDSTTYYANRSGLLQNMDGTTATFAPGTYTIYYGPGGLSRQMDKTCYYGTATVEDSNVTVSLSSQRFSQFAEGSGLSQAQYDLATSIYYNTSSFDHIHIRVEGSYVIHVGSATYTATVSNPTMVVRVDGVQKVSHSWTGTTDYEWTYRTSVSRTSLIEVDLTLDLTYTNSSGETVTMEDVTVSYNNRDHLYKFIEAIAICDAIQGLDFTVSVEDIEEVITYHTVTYQWMVYGLNGEMTALPVGAPLTPATTSGHSSDSEYVYDTEYVTGTSFYDYENGLLYTFHGWDTYSHTSEFNVNPNAKGMSALDDGDTDASNNPTIPITADTYINGYWTVTELAPAPAYIVIDKVFAGDTAAHADASDLWFRIDTGYDADNDGGGTVDVDYPQIVAAKQGANGEYRLPVYQYDTPFVITEHNAEVPGYTRTTTITVTGTNAAGTASGDTVTVTLTPEYEGENVKLGTVTYTNTYTKNVGEPIVNWPSLTLMKTASDTNLGQDGVVFTLYADAACTEAVTTVTTANGGLAYLNFGAIEGIQVGTYYLKETAAPAGYHADPHSFAITLTASAPVEELRGDSFVQITTHTLSVAPEDGCDAVYNRTLGRLHIVNDPIVGSLTINKLTNGLPEDEKANLDIVVIVHGPITRDSSNAITDIGSTWELHLNAANGFNASLAELPLGEYLLHESLASVHGYTWTGVTYGGLDTEVYDNITSALIKIESDAALELTLTNNYVEWTVGDFYIKKVDEAGNALPGATFQIFQMTESGLSALADEEFTITATTGADGYAHFTGFTVPEGQESVTYYLRETKAPEGFYLSDTLYKVELKAVTANGHTSYEPKISMQNADGAWIEAGNFDAANDLLTVTNYPVLGKLTLVKTFGGGIIPEGLSAVTLQVAGPNGFIRTVTLNAANNWSATLEGLALGTYTVTELDGTVPGYDLQVLYTAGGTNSASNAMVALTEANPGLTVEDAAIAASATVINTYTRREETVEIPASLTIRKTAADGTTPLAGAVFTMDRLGTDGNPIYTVSFTSNSDGIVIFDLLSGFIQEGQSIDGTYILTEAKAPEGYVKSDTVWTVTVKEDDGQIRVVLNEKQNLFENIWDWVVGGVSSSGSDWIWANDVLTVKNVKIIDELTVTKQWIASEGVAHPESVDVILYQDGRAFETVTLNAENNWTHSWTGLTEAHVWTVDEKAVPEGYEKTVTNEGYHFTITNTKLFKVISISVEKIWYGQGVAHPKSIDVVLYRDGTAFDTVTLTADTQWGHVWTDLTDEFTWTVDEPSVPSGYTKAVRQEGTHFTITNTHADIPKTGDDNNTLLWSGMLTAGLAGAAWMMILLLSPRKKETEA